MLRPDMYTIQEDRKYAELEAKFRAAEQADIIRLLSDSCECDGTDDGYNYCVYHKAVDLIKGESQNYNETVSLLTEGENK